MMHNWKTLFWYKAENRRYYRAELHQDLFGNWLLTRTWGSAYKLGRQTVQYLDTIEQGHDLLREITKKRHAKHYRPACSD
jgi:predicted DNA-binding WGR domain protein